MRSAPAVRSLSFLVILLLPVTVSAQGFEDRFNEALNRADAAIAETFTRSLPLPAASPGVSYSFDPVTGNFRRNPVTFGQVYVDRADPLGGGRVNLSFVYQYVQLDSIEGHDADDLSDPLPIPIDDLAAAFTFDELGFQAGVHQFQFAFTYGVTDNLEATIALPLVYSDLGFKAELRAVAFAEDGERFELIESLDEPEHPVGIGDVSLRAKYRFLISPEVNAAAGLLLRFPSGETDAYQGIGYFEVAPSILASSRVFEPASWARLQGHLNLTLGFDTEDVDSSEFRWGMGLDWGITESVTTAIAFLGRNEFASVTPPGAFDAIRCRSDLDACAMDGSLRNIVAPLFGITGERADYYTFSIGGRGALWRDTLFLFLNVAIPLNDGFVRTEPIPLFGLEGTF